MLVVVVVITFDQLSKYWASQQIEVIINPGISWGLGTQFSAGVIMIVITGVLVLTGWWLRSWIHKYPVPLGLLLGGGVSNLLDRIHTAGVRDWLPVPFTTLHNNGADYAIALGVIWLMIVLLSTPHDTRS